MSKRLPSLESLRILEACVRHASFTRAADELNVTPAAISLRVRNLESELGAKLFRRFGPRLEPTEAALLLAGRVAEALRLVQAAVAECRVTVPPLRLTVVPSFATRWLAPRLPRYHALPGTPSMRVDASSELRAQDDFDVAIRTGLGEWPGFEVTPLTPIEATPMLSPALGVSLKLCSPADLAKLPLLQHPDWRRWFREATVDVGRLYFCASEFPTHELDAAAAIQGAGVALLSPLLFASCLAERKLVQPFAHVIRGPSWHCLLVKGGCTHPAAQGFRAWLQEELQQLDPESARV